MTIWQGVDRHDAGTVAKSPKSSSTGSRQRGGGRWHAFLKTSPAAHLLKKATPPSASQTVPLRTKHSNI